MMETDADDGHVGREEGQVDYAYIERHIYSEHMDLFFDFCILSQRSPDVVK